MNVFIRNCTEVDCRALEEISNETGITSWKKKDFTRSVQRNELLFVAEAGEQIRGYIHLRLITSGQFSEYELLNVAVTPVFHNKGIATALFQSFLDTQVQKERLLVFLELRAGNAAAYALYSKLGFVETGRRKNYYRRPVEDAILMQLDHFSG